MRDRTLVSIRILREVCGVQKGVNELQIATEIRNRINLIHTTYIVIVDTIRVNYVSVNRRSSAPWTGDLHLNFTKSTSDTL